MPDIQAPQRRPEGRLVLITGATSGIGAAYARLLASQGHDLWLTGRRMAILEPMAERLRSEQGVRVTTQAVELSDEHALAALEEAVREVPDLYGLINNAGYADDGIFHLMTPRQHRAQMRVHMDATVQLAHAALPALESRQGFMINVASLASWLPTGGSPLYGPTKGFVRLFTETLAVAYHPTGIRFQALCPGFVITDFHSRMGLDPQTFYQRHGPTRAFPASWVVRRSLRDLQRGRVISAPGLHYQFLGWVIRNTPRPLLYRLLRFGMSRRYDVKGRAEKQAEER
ncbi:SDR family NAD(P)-dependent oxidoreductase [Natronospirillum operosum]|uniref:SDR family NAD(P)-dependent oxidoreductase n=1 Tax=Natronospirillum operosum TaxID=2759953 RepID=A0A4Z0W8V3_9GAMM|nr:SDR family NAD(P)-dependent oxidoreductase [Natronospirillum operosum]TGG93997.1 SDR family NAD(P)-dependent oxidoreductase [Natronospirillum operosum]